MRLSRDSSLVPDPSPQTALKQPFQTLLPTAPGAGRLQRRPEKAGVGKGLLCYSEKGLESGLQTWLRVAAVPLHPKTSITFTNTYINTLHTIASLGGRFPTEARLTQLHVSGILGKGAGLLEMGSVFSLLPRASPAQAHPSLQRFSLSSRESCRRWAWKLATWAAGSWAGCVDPSHSGHPVADGGVAAVNEAAGGQAGCVRMVGAHSQGLLQQPGAQWNPRPRAG